MKLYLKGLGVYLRSQNNVRASKEVQFFHEDVQHIYQFLRMLDKIYKRDTEELLNRAGVKVGFHSGYGPYPIQF